MKLISILIVLFSITLYANKMPGSYNNFKKSSKFIRDLGLRVQPKDGAFEHYYLEVKRKGSQTIKINLIYSVFNDKKANSQWLEMTLKSKKWGRNSFKMLYSDGLLQGNIKRLMLIIKAYNPFELPLDSILNKDFAEKEFGKNTPKIKFNFIRNGKVTLNNKEYNTRVYTNKTKEIEYAILDDKDTEIFGMVYAKTPEMEMFLKGFGHNAVSVFPKKVPILDFLNNLSAMGKVLSQNKIEKKKAETEEEKIENGGKDKIEDPIDRLNKMLEEESKEK